MFLSECNWTRTHNDLVRKRTLNQIEPVWLNGWVLIYKLSCCGFKSTCSHWNFRFRGCFEQVFPRQSVNYRVWIHSEARRDMIRTYFLIFINFVTIYFSSRSSQPKLPRKKHWPTFSWSEKRHSSNLLE